MHQSMWHDPFYCLGNSKMNFLDQIKTHIVCRRGSNKQSFSRKDLKADAIDLDHPSEEISKKIKSLYYVYLLYFVNSYAGFMKCVGNNSLSWR